MEKRINVEKVGELKKELMGLPPKENMKNMRE